MLNQNSQSKLVDIFKMLATETSELTLKINQVKIKFYNLNPRSKSYYKQVYKLNDEIEKLQKIYDQKLEYYYQVKRDINNKVDSLNYWVDILGL
jgi:vacuolar-type H+-ATPase subunit I/STV1